MSSTNVHSENKENNIYCAGAQIIPTEKEVEIPPKSAQKGPTSQEIILGDGMEIKVEESTLNEKGQLVGKDGNIVGKFSKEQVMNIEKNRKNRKTEKQNSARKSSKNVKATSAKNENIGMDK